MAGWSSGNELRWFQVGNKRLNEQNFLRNRTMDLVSRPGGVSLDLLVRRSLVGSLPGGNVLSTTPSFRVLVVLERFFYFSRDSLCLFTWC